MTRVTKFRMLHNYTFLPEQYIITLFMSEIDCIEITLLLSRQLLEDWGIQWVNVLVFFLWRTRFKFDSRHK